MKRKILSLLFTAIVTTSCVLCVPNTVNAADTVQSVTSINSDGKLIVDGTGVNIDSADIKATQEALNNNAEILTDVQDLAEQNETNIAQTSDEYSSSKTYKKGQLCIKDGSLYKCKVDINTAEAWTSSHWTKTSLASVSGNLSSEVSDLSDSLSSKLGDGQVSFQVIDGEPYVKVGADSPRPFKSGGTIKRVTLGAASYPTSGTYKYDISEYVEDTSKISSSNFAVILSSAGSNDSSSSGRERFSCSVSYAAPNVTFNVSSSQSGSNRNRALSCSCSFVFFYILN